MTRQELDDLLVDYLYDELEPARRAAFEAGLEEHPELAAAVEAHRATRSMAADLPTFALPAGLLDGVLAEAQQVAEAHAAAAIAEKRPGLFERLSRLILQPAFASAALAVVVIGVGVIYMARPDPLSDPNRQRLEPVVAVRPDPEAAGDGVKGGAAVTAAEAKGEERTPAPTSEGGKVEGSAASVDQAPAPPAPAPAPAEVDGAEAKGAVTGAVQNDDAEGVALGDASVERPSDSPKSADKRAAPRARPAKAKEEAAAKASAEPTTGADQLGLDAASDDGRLAKPAEPKPATTTPRGGGTSRGTADAAGASAPATGAKKDSYRSVRRGHGGAAVTPGRNLREVPIPVPSDEDKEKVVRTSDRAGALVPEPPPVAPAPAADTAKTVPEREELHDEEEAAAERLSVQRVDSGSSTTREEARQRAEARRKAAETARVAELWKRYDRYVASERWSDAEEVLDELEHIPSQVARVRALRPQLAKRKAAAKAERAAGKRETIKQPTTDSTYK